MNLEYVVEILKQEHSRRHEPTKPYSQYLAIIEAKNRVLDRFGNEFKNVESLAEAAFQDFLSFEHNEHWTGLKRSTSHVCDDMPKLIECLKHLFNEDIPIATRLDEVTMGGKFAVRGLGLGILTAVLLVRYPDRYGVWNGKSEAVLRATNAWTTLPRGTTDGQRYEDLNSFFVRVANEVGVDLWTLDGLWHVLNDKSAFEYADAFEVEEQEQRDYSEGKAIPTSGIRYERDLKARQDCIKLNGLDCAVCGFNFFETYGRIGLNFIHVHHVKDLSLVGEDYCPDPKRDLVPVCPNCHAMLHKGAKPARSVEDLKQTVLDRQTTR